MKVYVLFLRFAGIFYSLTLQLSNGIVIGKIAKLSSKGALLRRRSIVTLTLAIGLLFCTHFTKPAWFDIEAWADYLVNNFPKKQSNIELDDFIKDLGECSSNWDKVFGIFRKKMGDDNFKKLLKTGRSKIKDDTILHACIRHANIETSNCKFWESVMARLAVYDDIFIYLSEKENAEGKTPEQLANKRNKEKLKEYIQFIKKYPSTPDQQRRNLSLRSQ